MKKTFIYNLDDVKILHPDLIKKAFNKLREEITHGKYIMFQIDYNLLYLNDPYLFPNEKIFINKLLKPSLFDKNLKYSEVIVIELNGESVYNFTKYLRHFYLRRDKTLKKLIKKEDNRLRVNNIIFYYVILTKKKYLKLKNSRHKSNVY